MYYVFTPLMGLSQITNCPPVPMGTVRPPQVISQSAVERQLERDSKLKNNSESGESGGGWSGVILVPCVCVDVDIL